MNRRKNPQKEADAWNKKISIGDTVEFREVIDDQPQIFAVRSEAEVLSGHTSVVWLEGKRGCVATSHCVLVSKAGI